MFEIITAVFHAALLSFGLIAPLGMQNVFILNQGASQQKLRHAFPSVITAGVCDTFLIFMAILGVSLIIMETTWLKMSMYGFGFVFLLYMSYSLWCQSGGDEIGSNTISPMSWKKQVLFAASVSLLNPHAIIDTVAVIGTNSSLYEGASKLAFCLSTVLVSWIWFSSLAVIGHKLHKFENKSAWLAKLNRFAAIIILGVAIFIGIDFFKELANLTVVE